MNVSDGQRLSDPTKKEKQMFVNINPIYPRILYKKAPIEQTFSKEKNKQLHETIDVHYEKGIDLYKKSKYNEAIPEFQHILFLEDQISPKELSVDWYAHFWLFSSFWSIQAFDQAKAHLHKIRLENIPKDVSAFLFHHTVIKTLLKADLHDEEIEKKMEAHSKRFFEISGDIEGINKTKVKLYFTIGCAYNRLNTYKDDRKATHYFHNALQWAEKIPDKIDVEEIHLYLARIHYRKGDYTLAKKTFQKYTSGLNPFKIEDLHGFIGPFFSTFHLNAAYLLLPFPMPFRCIQIAAYSLRSKIFCYLPFILILKFVSYICSEMYYRHVQKKQKENFFYDVKAYPSNPIPGPIENLVASEQMVSFEMQNRICFWDIEKNENFDFNMSGFYTENDSPSLIKKICFSKKKDAFIVVFEDNHVVVGYPKKNKFNRYDPSRIALTDIVRPCEKGFTLVVQEKDNETASHLCDIHFFKELQENKKKNKTNSSLGVPYPFTISSFDFDPEEKYIALVGLKHVYFDLATENSTTQIVVEGYLRRFVKKIPSDIIAYIIKCRGLIPISSIPIENLRLQKDYFAPDGSFLYSRTSMISKASFSSDAKKVAISQKNELSIYDVTHINAPKLLYIYAHYFTEFIKLVWKDNDTVLYVAGKRKGENYHTTALFFLPCLKESMLEKCL